MNLSQSGQSFLCLADVDECEGEGPCGLHASCINTPGSYSCSCHRGYLMGTRGCQGLLASVCLRKEVGRTSPLVISIWIFQHIYPSIYFYRYRWVFSCCSDGPAGLSGWCPMQKQPWFFHLLMPFRLRNGSKRTEMYRWDWCIWLWFVHWTKHFVWMPSSGSDG